MRVGDKRALDWLGKLIGKKITITIESKEPKIKGSVKYDCFLTGILPSYWGGVFSRLDIEFAPTAMPKLKK